jgi:SAM-dependent methyltransferase
MVRAAFGLPVVSGSRACDDPSVQLFDDAAEEYDAARPDYPAQVYDLLESVAGSLSGRTVGDGGTGTGIVARQLLERGARVIGFDPGPRMLRRALGRTPALAVVVADAGAAPFLSGSMDAVCFGQSWHWVAQEPGAAEMARLVRPHGWWAAWWNHPWADGEPWFDRYYAELEARCDVTRAQRDPDWCAEAVRAHDAFDEPERHIVHWDRTVDVDTWIAELRSHSYVMALNPQARDELLHQVDGLVRNEFGDCMVVPYQTRVWLARRR